MMIVGFLDMEVKENINKENRGNMHSNQTRAKKIIGAENLTQEKNTLYLYASLIFFSHGTFKA